MFSRSSVTSKPGAEVVSGSPAILVLTTINSPFNKRELTLSQFTTNGNFQEFLPKSFQIEVKNTGNVHLIPQGNIFIDGQGKKDLAVLSINPNGLSALPDASRTYAVTWGDGFPVVANKDEDKKGTTFLDMTWDWSKADRFRFGRYTAHLLLVYDNGERDVPIESSISFWIIPWRLLILFTIVCIFLIIGLRSSLLSLLAGFKRLFNRFSRLPPPPTSS